MGHLSQQRDLWNHAIEELPLLFLDVETTGRDPARGHRICEIALLPAGSAAADPELCQLLDPEHRITHRARELHGLTQESLSGKPRFAEILDELTPRLQDHILVGHNIHFDIRFLAQEYQRAACTMPALLLIDTLSLSRQLVGALDDLRLAALVDHLNLRDEGLPMHRARHDAQYTRALFFWLCHHFEIQTLTDAQARPLQMTRWSR